MSTTTSPGRGDTATVRRRVESQRAFEDLGRNLRDLTFCVVDLETTGASARAGARITEIGAVKVRGGEVIGEFQTLVDPEVGIPTAITVLTGIDEAMLVGAPPISAALPSFLEFAAGCVLVAHNAPFDVGFLQHHAAELGMPWPRFEVVDTVRIARRVLTRDDARDCKLGTLATLFRATSVPDHRALSDARATVTVLHGLIERLGNLGVTTLEELRDFSAKVSDAQRRKRHLADALPHAPGVYLFRGPRQEVLYIGTSRDVRRRVRSYFTASESRSRMGEMIALAERVDAVECATPLEAAVRELRLIAEHKPRYNRRSRFPERRHFVKLTVEPWPRLALVRTVRSDGAAYLGPFSSRKSAEQARAALSESFRIRECTDRLAAEPDGRACVLAEMGRCLAPCEGSVSATEYAAEVDALRTAMLDRPEAAVATAEATMARLAAEERFEEAGRHRDRLTTLLRAGARTQRLSAVTRLPEIAAVRREQSPDATTSRWVVHVIRHGRLAAAGVIPAGADAHAYLAGLRASAETVPGGPGPVPAASAEESELILRWLTSPQVRLAHVEGEWSCPVAGAARHLPRHEAAEESRRLVTGIEDGARLGTLAQPLR